MEKKTYNSALNKSEHCLLFTKKSSESSEESRFYTKKVLTCSYCHNYIILADDKAMQTKWRRTTLSKLYSDSSIQIYPLRWE